MKISKSEDKIIKPQNLNSSKTNILEYTDTSKFDKSIPYDIEEYNRLKEKCMVNNSNIDFSKFLFISEIEKLGKSLFIEELLKNIAKYKKICK